jgi:hypothetical protein
MMHQEAPYPTILEALVSQCRMGLHGDWRVDLTDMQRDEDHGRGAAGGLTLRILTKGPDTYHPERGENYRVYHYFSVPAATYDERSWRRWLFERYLDVWRHEAMESFGIGAERPYAPSHGPGNDPYLVRELGTDEDRRTRFTGEVLDK